MRIPQLKLRLVYFCLLLALQSLHAQLAPASNSVQRIDLVAVLKLAEAQNFDIQIATERLAEAKAQYDATFVQFFPWVSAGAAYRRHENLLQDVTGHIVDVDKQSYNVGPTIVGEWPIGDAIFRRLAARESLHATAQGLEAQRHDSAYAAAQAYFDLAGAQSDVEVAREAIRISSNYLAQITRALEIGLAFKADVLRVQVQTERNQTTLSRAREQQRVASARLAQILTLDSTIELTPNESELVPLILTPTNAALSFLVAQALSARPELKQSVAQINVARKSLDSARFGPMVPTLGAQVFAGGLGGSPDGFPDRFGESEDYQVTLGWRIGPGGLFDKTRVRAADARLRIADLVSKQLSDQITAQVVEAQARVQSLAEQLASSERAVKAAQDTLTLSEQRKEFAVANVLEVIQAEQELTHARLDYFNSIAEFDKAQYALLRAIGRPPLPGQPAQK
jgi:outer membrane protein TolC